MRTPYAILLLALTSTLAAGQTARTAPADSQNDTYQSVTTFGITTNTNSGILGGISFRQARRLNGELFGMPQYQYLSVEIVNVKHPKELAASISSAGSRYIQGKENYFFVVRPQYGREVTLFQRDEDEGISVSGILAAGPSLGIIKPYYLDVQSGNSTRSVPASQVNGSSTATGEVVTGAGNIFQGFGESKLTVGLHIKAALSFELSAFRTNTTGVEVGFLTEIFPQKILIIPNTAPGANRSDGNRSFFTSAYLTLFFGSKK